MAEVTGVKVNELPKKTAYDESDLIYVVGNGVDLKMEMKDLKRNVAPDVFSGATELTPGEKGLVPTPTVTDSNKVLGGDGEWKELAPVATSGDFDDLINKPEITEVEANPTDTPTAELKKITIGTTTYSILSSKVYGEATGDLITIDDAMEAPAEALTVTLEPQQDLHGYDSPWVGGAGKNKLPLSVSEIKSSNGGANSWTNNSKEISGIVYTILTDSDENVIGIKANGTATANSILYLMSTTAPPIQLDGQSVIISTAGFSKGAYKDNSWHDILAPSTESAVTLNGDIVQMWGQINNGVQVNNIVIKPMVRLATVSDSTFAPYSNICPISGWDGAVVTRTGKNLWDRDNIRRGVYTNSDGTTQSASASTNFSSQFIKIKPNTIYSITMFGESYENGSLFGVYYDEYKNGIKQTTNIQNLISNNSKTFTTPLNAHYIVFSGYRGAGTDIFTTANTVVCEGTPTTYEPYNGHTYTIDLNGTRYGGELDVVNGEVIVNRALITFNGSENWQKSTSGNMYYLPLNNLTFDYGMQNINYNISNCYKFKTFTTGNYFSTLDDGEYLLYKYQGGNPTREIAIKNLSISTIEDWKTNLSNNNLQLVYELATPQTYQLTPTQVKSLLGSNNVWSDGEMYIKYRRDLDIFLNKLEARVRALEEG